ncbi:class I SAM-dependent DNA methyltransferase [Hoeflea sp.]|uniref:type I restriction-modification system subunit M n=1 Tax=Hoeflea sp. TaxID=1940281 RepID=UPI0019B13B38|nr:class I SAM-dependent DNA methyltransferase [Hoeflea sp.]MBC7284639.1 SAM-dependent DNA methyltransferase [Hoeflea sp.]
MNHSEIVSFLWGVADLIRDTFKRGKYQDVILPLTVLRRLDCVLAATKERVLKRQAELKGKGLQDLDAQLRCASGFAFYNNSRYDFEKLLADAPHLAANLRNYIAGFSPNMREVLERFDFDNTISKLDEAGLLFQVLERFKNVDLHPDKVDNPTMGTIFEELIRKFNEALNENPGEHFTPRDVVHLMVDLMLAGDEGRIRRKGIVCTVYDPCCGSGGMLMITKEHITTGWRRNGDIIRPPINPDAEIHLFGQEVNPETWAVSKSDLFMKDPTGRDADNIAYGSVLSNDRHAGRSFDYLIANPPYGKDWKRDEDAVRAEHERGASGRFAPGLPRISDGQLLFLLHMLAHMKEPKEGGSRIAIIMNGSPLFTGDGGSGESEIRRYILENDLLEALIALPEQLFYNTGIATYVWLLTNRKAPERRGKVQLIDASGFWVPMRKSLGDKRREIPPERAQDILKILADFRDGDTRRITKDEKEEEVVVSRIFPTTHFGYRKITVERPLRLNFQATTDRIARLEEEKGFQNLAQSKKKGAAGEKERAEGRRLQDAIRAFLRGLPDTLFKDRTEFEPVLDAAARKANLKLSAPVRKAILSALSERDETAAICRDKDGNPEPDPVLRDTERVPLPEGDDPADADGVPASVRAFFDREVRPHVPDACIDTTKRDPKDGRVGLIGYEINFNRYFYRYTPPRPIEEIEADIRAIGQDIVRMLAEVTGTNAA